MIRPAGCREIFPVYGTIAFIRYGGGRLNSKSYGCLELHVFKTNTVLVNFLLDHNLPKSI